MICDAPRLKGARVGQVAPDKEVLRTQRPASSRAYGVRAAASCIEPGPPICMVAFPPVAASCVSAYYRKG